MKYHCPHCLQESNRKWNMKMHIRRRHDGIGHPFRNGGLALDNQTQNVPFSSSHRDRMLRAGESFLDDRRHDFIEDNLKRLKTFKEHNDLMRELFRVAPIYPPFVTRYHYRHYNYCRNCGFHTPSPSIRSSTIGCMDVNADSSSQPTS